MIALSQIVLRLKTPPEKLRVKMWFFPVLSILTVAGIVAVLVQMAFDSSARTQFWLSLLSWAVGGSADWPTDVYRAHLG